MEYNPIGTPRSVCKITAAKDLPDGRLKEAILNARKALDKVIEAYDETPTYTEEEKAFDEILKDGDQIRYE